MAQPQNPEPGKRTRDATVITKISKTSARLLGPAIGLLDAKGAEGLLRVQTRANIDRYYLTTRDLMGKVKMHQMAARGDHIGVVLYLLSQGYQYRNMKELLDRWSSAWRVNS